MCHSPHHLASYNQNLLNDLSGSLLQYETPRQPPNALARVLLTHTEMYTQLGRLREILPLLGLPPVDVGAGQVILFEAVQGFFQGSGLRALYPIVAALTDQNLRVILIDEPEISLEPELQKALRDLLVEHATGGRTVVVATHSHLFLDREVVHANEIVHRTETGVSVDRVESEEQLMDVVFRLLGSSTEDLFFPGNYAITEGASDQVILERALELLGAPRGRVKVLAAGGITGIEPTVYAVERALLPMVVSDSPHASRIVAMIDHPPDDQATRVAELRKHLGDRLIELPADTIEDYLPEEIYQAAGLLKADELARIAQAQTLAEKREAKRTTSNALAAVLPSELLDLIPEIKHAAETAMTF